MSEKISFVSLKDAIKQSGLTLLYFVRAAKEEKIALYFARANDDIERQKIDFSRRILDKDGKECLEVKRNGKPMAVPIIWLESKKSVGYLWITQSDFDRMKQSSTDAAVPTAQETQDDLKPNAKQRERNYRIDSLLKVIGIILDVVTNYSPDAGKGITQEWIVKMLLDKYASIPNAGKRTVNGIMADAKDILNQDEIKGDIEAIFKKALESIENYTY